MRLMLQFIGVEDSDKDVREKMKKFKDIPIYRLVLKKCNLQEKNT